MCRVVSFYTIIIPTDEKDKKINSMNLFSECEYKNLKNMDIQVIHMKKPIKSQLYIYIQKKKQI